MPKRKNKPPKPGSYVNPTVRSRKTGKVDKGATKRVRVNTASYNTRNLGASKSYIEAASGKKVAKRVERVRKKAKGISEARARRNSRH